MTDYTELKRLAEAISQKDIADPIESKRVMLVEPAAVLALIAENERLQQREQDLSASVKYWFNACGGKQFEAGVKHADEAASKYIDEHWRRQRDQLRAENAGLRTGYEAYEQVNAELKAEVELLRSLLGQSALAATTLRTDAEAYANHSGFNRVFVDLIRSISGVEVGHGYGSSKYPQQADVVAALGQGEQS